MAKITALSIVLGCILAMPTSAQDLSIEARAASARGDTSAAIIAMQAHVDGHPDDVSAKLDLARYYMWTGAYAKVDSLLSPLAAQNAEAAALLASNAAWAGKIDQALALNAAGLQNDPANFMANYTQATALRQTAQAYRAWPYVQAVEQAKPGSKDAIDLRRITRVRTASEVSVNWGLTDDSDDIQVNRFGLDANIRLADHWRLLGNISQYDYSAPFGSGYEPISGGTSIDDTQYWIGISNTPAQDSQWIASIGTSDSDAGNEFIGLLRWNQRVNDDWSFSLDADRNRLGISPRSVSLGLMRNQYLGQIRINPGFNWVFDGYASFQDISDGNNSIDLQIAGRRAVVRTQKVQLDLGAAAQWLSFDEYPNNGYYSPSNYRRISLTASAYFPFGDNYGLALRAGLGIQRDETFDNWESANDISLEYTAGILSDWEFKAFAGYSDRAQPAGLYDTTAFGMQLKRRF